MKKRYTLKPAQLNLFDQIRFELEARLLHLHLHQRKKKYYTKRPHT